MGDGNCMSIETAARKRGMHPKCLARVLGGRGRITPALTAYDLAQECLRRE